MLLLRGYGHRATRGPLRKHNVPLALRRLVVARWHLGQITCVPEEIGLYIDEVASGHTDFVAADEAERIAPRIGMIELLGNHGIARGRFDALNSCGHTLPTK